MMAEQATTDSSLEKILQLICNGDIEEPFGDDSNPIESIIPGKISTKTIGRISIHRSILFYALNDVKVVGIV